MKNKIAFILILVFFTCFLSSIWGLELELSAGAGNISFNPGNDDYLGNDDPANGITPKAYSPSLYLVADFRLAGDVWNNGYFSLGFERDSILRNRLYGNMGFRLSYFSLEIGPFIGLMNTKQEMFRPGVSTGFRMEFPGILFAHIRAASSMGSAEGMPGNYSQRSGGFSAGFWAPNVICSFNIDMKSFALQRNSGLFIEDSMSRYFFRADVSGADNPLSFVFDMGYGSLKRTYVTHEVPGAEIIREAPSDEVKFLFLGLKGAYSINPSLKVFISGEIPLYFWSVRPMKNPSKTDYLYNFSLGVTMNFRERQ